MRANRHDKFPPYNIRPYFQLVETDYHQREHSLHFLDDHHSACTMEVVIYKHKNIDNKSSKTCKKDNYNMKNVLCYSKCSHVFLSNFCNNIVIKAGLTDLFHNQAYSCILNWCYIPVTERTELKISSEQITFKTQL
jgi:hypothetical protein